MIAVVPDRSSRRARPVAFKGVRRPARSVDSLEGVAGYVRSLKTEQCSKRISLWVSDL